MTTRDYDTHANKIRTIARYIEEHHNPDNNLPAPGNPLVSSTEYQLLSIVKTQQAMIAAQQCQISQLQGQVEQLQTQAKDLRLAIEDLLKIIGE